MYLSTHLAGPLTWSTKLLNLSWVPGLCHIFIFENLHVIIGLLRRGLRRESHLYASVFSGWFDLIGRLLVNLSKHLVSCGCL